MKYIARSAFTPTNRTRLGQMASRSYVGVKYTRNAAVSSLVMDAISSRKSVDYGKERGKQVQLRSV